MKQITFIIFSCFEMKDPWFCILSFPCEWHQQVHKKYCQRIQTMLTKWKNSWPSQNLWFTNSYPSENRFRTTIWSVWNASHQAIEFVCMRAKFLYISLISKYVRWLTPTSTRSIQLIQITWYNIPISVGNKSAFLAKELNSFIWLIDCGDQ